MSRQKLQPINLKVRHVAASGLLPLPPPEQGQPVIFQAGAADGFRLIKLTQSTVDGI